MSYKYSNEFQGHPCRYDWYERFSNAVNTGDQEGTLIVYDVVDGEWTPMCYVTNLYCTDELDVVHGGETITVPVYTVGTVNCEEQIDPLMVESKIPSLDFTITFEHITRDYTLAELDEITKSFEDKVVKFYRGFFSYSGELRNENGTANLSYDEFDHDLECLGTFLITESEYDYNSYTVTCSTEHLAFSKLRDTKFYSSDPYWNQRYPYPYDDDRYLLGYPADKILDGSLFGQLNYKGTPLYGKGTDVEGLSTKHICDHLWVQPPKTSDDPVETWQEHIFEYNYGPYEGKYQFTETGQPIDFKCTGVWWQNGDEVPSDEWMNAYYYDSDGSGVFSAGDSMVEPLYGGEKEIFTENSDIYFTGDSRYLWNGEEQTLTVRWKSLLGTEPGAVRSFSVYEHGSDEPLENKQGSRYILDDDGMYYTEAEFSVKEIGVYDVKCWYGTYQFDASITFAVTPVVNFGDAPAFGGHGETPEESFLGYHLVTVNSTVPFDEIKTFEALSSKGFPFESVYYKIFGWTNGGTQPVVPEWVTTGKVQSATLDAMPGTQVGKTIIYGASKQEESRLPEGYTEIEYIESTGTQWIDTAFKPNQNTRVQAKVDLSKNSLATAAVFGGRTTNRKDSFSLWVVSSSLRTDYGTDTRSTGIEANGLFEIDKNKQTTIINGNVTTNTSSVFSASYSLAISACKGIGSDAVDERMTSMLIYYFKIEDNGILVRDFVPCVNSDGIVGLYDLVGSTFYGNNGTGNFIAGNEISSPIVPMENIGLSIAGQKWNIDLGGNTLGDGQTLTIQRDGTADIDGESITSQVMPFVTDRNVEVTTASSMTHYFDLEYQKYQETVVVEPEPPIDIPIEPGNVAFNFDWSFRSNELELQKVNTEYYRRNLKEPTDLTSLCNTWSDVTMDNGLISFCLMNNLHILPVHKSGEVTDGSWGIVSGIEPTKCPFLNIDGNNEPTNGKYFSEIADERYKINVAMILSDGFSKSQLDIEDVTHTKETLVNVGNLSGEESESFSFPIKDRFTSSTDIDSSGDASPSDSVNGYEYTSLLPLTSDVWFDTKNITVMNGEEEVGKLFGADQPASALMGGKNYAVRGNSLVAYDVLWNDKLNLTKDLDQPFTLRVPKYSPTEYYVDSNGNTTSEDDELTTVETDSAYYGYEGLSKRMVDRSNGTWLNPLYELGWKMVDDPSLRVGTLVYVPVHNQYVETYITEQKRSFDGSGSLSCVGWAIRETDEEVLAANPVDCKGTHWAGDPNDETKGDFVTFEWEENIGWSGLYGQLVRGVLTYESRDGSTVVKLADQFFTSGEPMAYSFNWFTLEQNLGTKIDTLAENGDFYIELFYYTYEVHGKTKFEYENIIPSHQPFSYLYAGYTVASNEVAPIAFNHYLIG